MASAAFSPPEQNLGDGTIGPWSDLFALGRSFLSVLDGKLDSYPRPLKASLGKATRLEIEDRFQSAEEWKMYLLEEGKQKRSYIWVWPIIIVCLLIAAVPLFYGTRKSSDSDSTIEQKQTKSVILPIQAPSANNTPPIPYQEGNPHPVPEAPLSLMGTRLTLSSNPPVSTYLSKRSENNYSIGQQ